MRESGFYQFLMIIWPLAVTVKGFESFLLFKEFRSLYVLISESVKDAINFIVIQVYICFAIALVNSLMTIGLIDYTLVEQSMAVFLEALGDFERPTRDNIPVTFLRVNAWMIVLLLQLITNIVALNTLIAIIADSYERVQNDRESYDALQRVELLDELNDFYMLFNRAERRLVFLNVVSYASRGDDENNEWGGRLKIITKTLESGISKVRSEVKGIKSEIAANKTETDAAIKAEIASIKAEMKDQFAQLTKLLTK